jgi:hypothetical protein
MSPVAFEPTIPANERPQTHALDRATTGIGQDSTYVRKFRLRTLPSTSLEVYFYYISWAADSVVKWTAN